VPFSDIKYKHRSPPYSKVTSCKKEDVFSRKIAFGNKEIQDFLKTKSILITGIGTPGCIATRDTNFNTIPLRQKIKNDFLFRSYSTAYFNIENIFASH